MTRTQQSVDLLEFAVGRCLSLADLQQTEVRRQARGGHRPANSPALHQPLFLFCLFCDQCQLGSKCKRSVGAFAGTGSLACSIYQCGDVPTVPRCRNYPNTRRTRWNQAFSLLHLSQCGDGPTEDLSGTVITQIQDALAHKTDLSFFAFGIVWLKIY